MIGWIREWSQGHGTRAHAISAAASLALLVGHSPQAKAAYSTPGQFDVRESGAATYDIPIDVPPGTAGLQPALSISYASGGGNGLLGVGWSLNGMSAVTRCAATVAQDGTNGSINYDSADRFCLDGERLVAVTGSYGAIGTEYRLERESFSKILSYGGSAGNPQYFRVWTKAGQILDFGTTPDSRIEALGSTFIRAWAMQKVADTKGNFLTVTYTEDTTEGQFYPNQINYTGNGSVAPYAHVTFVYANRPADDLILSYEAGSKNRITKRLTNVRTYLKGAYVGGADQLVSDYRLTYDQSPSTKRSRLIGLRRCAAITGTTACLEPSVFNYQEATPGFSSAAQGSAYASGATDVSGISVQGFDVNGDGRADLATLNAATLKIHQATGASAGAQYTSVAAQSLSTGSLNGAPIDINGDGRSDWLSHYVHYNLDENNQATVRAHQFWALRAYNVAASGVPTGNWSQQSAGSLYIDWLTVNPPDTWLSPYEEERLFFGDFNGDGRTDIYMRRSWRMCCSGDDFTYYADGRLYISNGSGWNTPIATGGFSDSALGLTLGLNQTNHILVMDVNGDGKSDLVTRLPNGTIHTELSNGSGFVLTGTIATTITDYAGASIWTVDVNGDGKSDIVSWGTTGTLTIYLSTGKSFINAGTFSSGVTGTNAAARFYWTDLNRDGRADFLVRQVSGTADGKFDIYLSNGSTFVAAGTYTPHTDVLNEIKAASYVAGRVTLMDVNGDGAQDFVVKRVNGNVVYYPGPEVAPDFISGITDGLGAYTNIMYSAMTDASVYTKEYIHSNPYPYPTIDVQGGWPLVSRVRTENGNGIFYISDYAYEGGKFDAQGRGFLGFKKFHVTDTATGIRTSRTLAQTYPYIGATQVLEKRNPLGALLNQVSTTYSATSLGGTRYFTYASQIVEKSWELTSTASSGVALPTTTTTQVYDTYGNPTSIVVSSSSGHVKTTTNTYTNNATTWHLGRLTRATMASKLPDNTTQTRTSSFAYDATSGLLTKETVEPDTAALRVITDYGYDAFGNKTSVTVSGSGITTRTSTTTYDAQGRFATSSSNALSQSESRTFDKRFGGVLSLTGPNALTSSWTYDQFGRKTSETQVDGVKTSLAYWLCATGCGDLAPAHAAYSVTSTVATASAPSTIIRPVETIWYDRLNRELLRKSQGFAGTGSGADARVLQATIYDNLGRVWKKSRPYYEGQAAYYIEYAYDILGRTTKEIVPNTGSMAATEVQTTYSGLTTSTKLTYAGAASSVQRTRTVVKNSQDQVVQVTDPLSGVTTYEYDHFGNLTKVTDPAGNVSTATYNLRGFKTASTDPDRGSWSFITNVLGEVTRETNARGQQINMTYDVLGRMRTRTSAHENSVWTYDSATKGIGKLASVTGSGTASGSGTGYSRSHTYDSLGRPSTVAITRDGATSTFTTTYTARGEVNTLTYPNGLVVKHVYTPIGYLSELRNNSTNSLYWKALAANADGEVTQSEAGNGLKTVQSFAPQTGRIATIQTGPVASPTSIQNLSYAWDHFGNLTSRFDSNHSGSTTPAKTETFAYDRLDRLTSSTLNGSAVSVAYNSIGNITAKDGVTYTYAASGSGSVRPKAVSGRSVGGTSIATYAYDASGNMTSGDGRTLTWTSFDMPLTISQGATSMAYVYDPERNRSKQTTTGTGAEVRTFLSAFGIRAEKVGANWENFLFVGDLPVGMVIQSGTTATRYFHTDHLGSVHAITNEAGGLVERLSYDAWGKRRLPTGLPGIVTPITTDRGYTGHQHLDTVGLIHMNGRVYDPTIGRFMSADPFVQDPLNSQALNPYTYVLNNPLSYTDPSGFFFDKIGKAIGKFFKSIGKFISKHRKALFGLAFAVILQQWYLPAMGIGGLGSAMISGAVSGAISSGGDLQSIFISAFTAAAFYGVGQYAKEAGWVAEGSDGAWRHTSTANLAKHSAAHGMVGGLSAVASGGKFHQGFLAAGVSKFAGPTIDAQKLSIVGGLVAHSVVGGTVSAISGGKFANGAHSAAFGYLFNELASHSYQQKSFICHRGMVGCSEGVVGRGLLGAAYPGQPAGTIVEDGASYYVGNNPITTYVDPSNLSVTNVTQDGHIFHSGSVVRSVVSDRLHIYVQTTGTGTNSSWGNAALNWIAGKVGFDPSDSRIRAYVGDVNKWSSHGALGNPAAPSYP